MNGKRQDLSQRPELLKGQVEYVAGPEYCLRPPMFPTYLFLLGRSLLRLRRRHLLPVGGLGAGLQGLCCGEE